MILDTNALSAFLGGDRQLRQVIAGVRELYLPVIVLGEYYFGLLDSRQRRNLEARLYEFVGESKVLRIDAETVLPYAEIRSELKHAGRPLPSNDVWIAALARQHSLRVVSRDAHFDCVTGIKRQSW